MIPTKKQLDARLSGNTKFCIAAAMTTIATWNVNSVKARLSNVLAWLESNPVDILLLQELKCETDAFPAMEFEDRGYNLAIHGQKTYNGVAICSKFPLEDVMRGLPEISSRLRGEEVDAQARYIEALVNIPNGVLRVASAYIPNGQEVGSDKFLYKLNFLDRLYAHWQERLAWNEMAVLGGDFNVAPEAIDVHDPKAWEGNILFHPEERARLRALLHLGLYDAFRVKHPTTQQFSWWDYRGGGYERGIGARIDHLLLSGIAVDKLSDVAIDESPRGQEKPSDHAPVVCTITL